MADALAAETRWIMAGLHYTRTGSMPEPLDHYPVLVLQAIWDHLDDAVTARSQRLREATDPDEEYDRARSTGDPEIDRWEREIADGRTPEGM